MKNSIYIVGVVLIVGSLITYQLMNATTMPASSERLEQTSGGVTPITHTSATSSTTATVPTTPTVTSGTYTLAEVATHNVATNCWLVVDGTVLDVTSFIASGQHNSEIMKGCGIDASSMFEAVRKHSSSDVQALFTKYTIGTVRS